MAKRKNFSMFTRTEDGLDLYLQTLEDCCGGLTYRHADDFITEFDKDQIIANAKSEPMQYWVSNDAADHFFMSVFPDGDNPFVVQIDAFGNTRDSYEDQFQSLINVASKYGHTGISGFSDEKGDTWLGYERMEIAFDEPAHPIMGKEYQTFMVQKLGLTNLAEADERSVKSAEQKPEIDYSDIEMKTRHGMSRVFG